MERRLGKKDIHCTRKEIEGEKEEDMEREI